MFTLKIAYARALMRLAGLIWAAQQRLASIDAAVDDKQRVIRSVAEQKAKAARRAETDNAQWVADVAQQLADKKRAAQAADERAITEAAWKN
jgi:hypothetical protein